MNEEVYRALVEELRATKTERIKNSREEAMRAVWECGKAILAARTNLKENHGAKLVQTLAKDIEMSVPWVYQAIAIATKFPDFETIYQLPPGQNISIAKLIRDYIPRIRGIRAAKEKVICPKCGSLVLATKLLA